MKIIEIMKKMAELEASDVHITTGSPPQLRVDGDLVSFCDKALTAEESKALSCSVLTEKQKKQIESMEKMEIDFSFGIKDIGRFRANVHYQRGSIGLALRSIPYKIPTIEELSLPGCLKGLCDKPKGLVLVTGATGNGKSTTMAAMVDRVNSLYKKHIITIEDPIEFIHRNKKSLITQREVGQDTFSFHDALRTILRQDPDVVLIGEMRDLETIEATLTIAETGHLTMATLHTNSAVETINRVIDVFPSNQQAQVRTQLSFVLEGILCQQLIPKANGKGRAMAMEIMFPNSAIRNLIREGKTHQIYSNMQTSQAETSMQTMSQSLFDLYHSELISEAECMQRAPDQKEMRRLIEGRDAFDDTAQVKKVAKDFF
jgi:twitching motility protein PilT